MAEGGLVLDIQFRFCKMKRVLEMDSGDGVLNGALKKSLRW